MKSSKIMCLKSTQKRLCFGGIHFMRTSAAFSSLTHQRVFFLELRINLFRNKLDIADKSTYCAEISMTPIDDQTAGRVTFENAFC